MKMRQLCTLFLLLLPVASAWAAGTGVQRLRCDVLSSDKAPRTSYLNVQTVDMGNYWFWRADGDCATFLFDSPRSNTVAPTYFPKSLPGGDWKDKLVIDFTGKGGYGMGTGQLRYHAMPKYVTSGGQDMDVDVKINHQVTGAQSENQYEEESALTYAPATGALLRMSGKVKGLSKDWNSFTLINCNTAGVNCPGGAPAAATIAPESATSSEPAYDKGGGQADVQIKPLAP
ncbi:hypothetical protein [Silvimonas amylolytica]|uniref:Uncharacterized protein n=1 Tax=Silvimonas amylolytica TaxID=449663 RepID=A0ABQ2PNE1_9NEIS|nr:hypothetical protein [Silvimonas amylolytica]GGP26721.1 hypothetical protein GCM10010971_25400 [Silvimonas amylolytica]